ncbi:hypothetical protein V1478_018376 [Vespula squamosa]|uniref:Uncharacterized protein n=1 Tax=Vespula squamosa TaxID=30214 RepID=A0ABD1ZUV7_VESSQ
MVLAVGGGGGPVMYNAITLVFTAVSNQGDNLVTNYEVGPSNGAYESLVCLCSWQLRSQNLANIGSQLE